jgi:predicted Zn-dependent peptidase
MYDPFSKFNKHVLSNGLEVHSTFMDRPWVRIGIVIHAGGREDPVEIPGLAHFVEHVVSQNIPNFTFDKAREFFELSGGSSYFGSTSYLSTVYGLSVPLDKEILKEALCIFGSMLLKAQIKNNIEKERKVITCEFNGCYPLLDQLQWDMEIRKAVFSGHRLETWNRPLGRPEGFLSITEKHLQGFYDKYYVPENMSLVIVGGLTDNELLSILEDSPFSVNKSGTRNSIPEPFSRLSIVGDNTKVVKMSDHSNFSVDQSEYSSIWSFPVDFNVQGQKIFTQVLNKILFEQIREKRTLAYSISSYCRSFQNILMFGIEGDINPTATSQISDLVRMCISMVPERLDLFKRKIASEMKSYSMVDFSGQGLIKNCTSDIGLYQRIKTMKEEYEELLEVKFEHMSEMVSLLDSKYQYTFIKCP